MAWATREIIGRVSLLLYFVVAELLVSELLVFVWVEVAVDSTPSPTGAAVRSAIRSWGYQEWCRPALGNAARSWCADYRKYLAAST